MSKLNVSRRHFLAGAGALAAAPYIIPASALGKAGRPAPSARLNLGVIGYGTMAHDNIGNFLNNDRVQVVAVSDPNRGTDKLYGYNGQRGGGMAPCKQRVDKFYAEKTGQEGYNSCKTFADFRELLDSDVDVVMISTPDHWHALQAIYAARKGKHVYCQKPMSLSIGQGIAMVRAVEETGITFQVGSQQRSSNEFRRACEFVRNGYVGKIKRVEIGLPGGGFNAWGKPDEYNSKTPLAKPPDYFGADGFKMWLGAAPVREFIPAIHSPMSWRFNLDYGGGFVTDWGAHHLDILQWAVGKDGSGPVAVENIKGDMNPADPVWNTAGHYEFEVVYADGTRAFVSDKYPNGLRFFGEDSREIFVTRGKMETAPAELYRTKLKDTDTKLYVSGQHEKNFVECIYSGEPTITPCHVGHRSISIAHMANIGLRLGRKNLKWDPKDEHFIGDAEADGLINKPLHNGWSLDPAHA